MKNKEIKPIKLRIGFELAYEIIFVSIFIIFVGLAYLFASNLLRFNWFTVLFACLALAMLFLRFNSYLIIEEHTLHINVFRFFTLKQYDMQTVDEFVFYENSNKIEVKSNKKTIIDIYLPIKNRFKLLDWLVKHYPDIPCLYL